jgi:Histidine kinase-, DNA gyrase B-, and HSP90-like ATPase
VLLGGSHPKHGQLRPRYVNLNNVLIPAMREELAAMTRWSLRRLLGGTQDSAGDSQPVTETVTEPVTEPGAGRPQAALPHAERPLASRQPAGGPAGNWFETGRGRAPRHGAAQPGEPAAAPYGTSPYGGSTLGASQPGAVAVLAPPPGQAPARERSADSVPAAARDALAEPGQAEAAGALPDGPWPDICDQFGLHLLVLAEQLRASLDELEADEDDPDRLRRLYQVDHAVTRMRRASRDLRTLAGRSEEELAGFTTSLLDVIRMAASGIERYTQVTIGRVTDLAVLGYAADDIGSLMSALLDNATRYSPGTVSVSAHLLDDGSVMFRVEDTGIGIGVDQVAALNAAFAGPVPDVDDRTGRHTGFPVVHRIARKHSVGVRLAARPLPSSGTVVMVSVPPHLLCEVPAEEIPRRPAAAQGPAAAPGARPAAVTELARAEPEPAGQQPPQWEPPELADRDQPRQPGDLPRRERASLRGDEPRARPAEPAAPRTPEQQAAARRAFAEELTAFTLGAAVAQHRAGDAAVHEEAQQ